MQHPQETRHTQEGHNIPPPPHEGRHSHGIPRGAEPKAESSQARGHGPQLAPAEEENEAMLGGHLGNEEPHHPPPGTEEQSWEQRFRSFQLDLDRVKEVVKGRTPDTMDTLVQQTESPLIVEVLCYPLPAKFRIPSTTSILTRIKWSCMGIKTLYGAGLSPLTKRHSLSLV